MMRKKIKRLVMFVNDLEIIYLISHRQAISVDGLSLMMNLINSLNIYMCNTYAGFSLAVGASIVSFTLSTSKSLPTANSVL